MGNGDKSEDLVKHHNQMVKDSKEKGKYYRSLHKKVLESVTEVSDIDAVIEQDDEAHQLFPTLNLYHPINEFEPFLESLGLSQTQSTSLVPQDLIALSDDQVLLDNYQVLCDYGFPMSKIGMMYMEANEIFKYEL
ncbi:unnamed protein product [Fraxinus pennsylvanica]|uniref:Uncharacterized protein n=1 Tax=Fraxinus pennsylvanica TaxID=56036 RepID=A0AAD1ZJ66_9LAMI|nr:unnamed protein product [Fraxinus pennsylvanica]